MMNFAYLDRGGILHVTKKRKTALTYAATGKYVETDHPAMHGYPLFNGEEVVMYGPEEAYINGNGSNGRRLSQDDLTDLRALYESCL